MGLRPRLERAQAQPSLGDLPVALVHASPAFNFLVSSLDGAIYLGMQHCLAGDRGYWARCARDLAADLLPKGLPA